MRSKIIVFVPVIIAAFLFCGCGVKGDPTPPEKAAELGRGHTNYQKSAKISAEAPKNIENKVNDDDEEKDDQDE